MKLLDVIEKIDKQMFLGMYRPTIHRYPIYEEDGFLYYDGEKNKQKMHFSTEDLRAEDWETTGLRLKFTGEKCMKRSTLW
jgi:hypothetical protein